MFVDKFERILAVIGGGLISSVIAAFVFFAGQPYFGNTSVKSELMNDEVLKITINLHNTALWFLVTLGPATATNVDLQLKVKSDDYILTNPQIVDGTKNVTIREAEDGKYIVFTTPRIVKFEQVPVSVDLQKTNQNSTSSSIPLLEMALMYDQDRITVESYPIQEEGIEATEGFGAYSEKFQWVIITMVLSSLAGIILILIGTGVIFKKVVMPYYGSVAHRRQNKKPFHQMRGNLKREIKVIEAQISTDIATYEVFNISSMDLPNVREHIEKNSKELHTIELLNSEIRKRNFDILHNQINSERLIQYNKSCLELARNSLEVI